MKAHHERHCHRHAWYAFAACCESHDDVPLEEWLHLIRS